MTSRVAFMTSTAGKHDTMQGDDDGLADMAEKSIRSKLEERKSTHVADVRKKSLFGMVDSDASGTIDQAEFGQLYDVIREQTKKDVEKAMEAGRKVAQTKRKLKLAGCVAFMMCVFLGLSVVANFLMTFTLLEATKETTTDNSTGIMAAKGSDVIVASRIAEENLPLYLAPVLEKESLTQVKSLSVTLKRPYFEDEEDVAERSTVKYSVTGYVWNSATRMYFKTVEGDQIHIHDGSAYVKALDGTVYDACSASAACSSFRVSGVNVTEARELAEAYSGAKNNYTMGDYDNYTMGDDVNYTNNRQLNHNPGYWQNYAPIRDDQSCQTVQVKHKRIFTQGGWQSTSYSNPSFAFDGAVPHESGRKWLHQVFYARGGGPGHAIGVELEEPTVISHIETWPPGHAYQINWWGGGNFECSQGSESGPWTLLAKARNLRDTGWNRIDVSDTRKCKFVRYWHPRFTAVGDVKLFTHARETVVDKSLALPKAPIAVVEDSATEDYDIFVYKEPRACPSPTQAVDRATCKTLAEVTWNKGYRANWYPSVHHCGSEPPGCAFGWWGDRWLFWWNNCGIGSTTSWRSSWRAICKFDKPLLAPPSPPPPPPPPPPKTRISEARTEAANLEERLSVTIDQGLENMFTSSVPNRRALADGGSMPKRGGRRLAGWQLKQTSGGAYSGASSAYRGLAFAFSSSIFKTAGKTYAITYGGQGLGGLITPYSAVQILELTDPANPKAIWSHYQTSKVARYGFHSGPFDLFGTRVIVDTFTSGSDTYAVFLTACQASVDCGAGMTILKVTDPTNPNQVSKVDVGGCNTGTALTTFTDVDGKPKAIAGCRSGKFEVHDFSNPALPKNVGGTASWGGGLKIGQVGAITTVVIDGKDYGLFTCGESGSWSTNTGLTIVDLSTNPPTLVSAVRTHDKYIGSTDSKVFYADFVGEPMAESMSVRAVKAHGKVYAVMTSMTSSGFAVIDISDPTHPRAPTTKVGEETKKASRHNFEQDGQGSAFAMMQNPFSLDTFSSGGRQYGVIAAGRQAGKAGLQVVDLTDPEVPLAAASKRNKEDGFDMPAGGRPTSVKMFTIEGGDGEDQVYAFVTSAPSNNELTHEGGFQIVGGFEELPKDISFIPAECLTSRTIKMATDCILSMIVADKGILADDDAEYIKQKLTTYISTGDPIDPKATNSSIQNNLAGLRKKDVAKEKELASSFLDMYPTDKLNAADSIYPTDSICTTPWAFIDVVPEEGSDAALDASAYHPDRLWASPKHGNMGKCDEPGTCSLCDALKASSQSCGSKDAQGQFQKFSFFNGKDASDQCDNLLKWWVQRDARSTPEEFATCLSKCDSIASGRRLSTCPSGQYSKDDWIEYGMSLYHDLGYGKLDPANLAQAGCYWEMACTKAGSSGCTCVDSTAAKAAVQQAIEDAVAGNLKPECEGYTRTAPAGRRRLNHACSGEHGLRGCHPPHATVELASGAHSRLDTLAVGDSIRTPAGFEPVVGFLHSDANARMAYHVFTTEANLTMAISDKHFLLVDGVEADPATVKLGQSLATPHGPQVITAIAKQTFVGAYHPITASGAYYVDGIAASTYVSYIPHAAWKVVGDGYITLRYKLGLPVVPEGAHPVTLFWFLDALTAVGVPEALQSSLFWPLIAGSVAITELVSAAGLAIAKMPLPAVTTAPLIMAVTHAVKRAAFE